MIKKELYPKDCSGAQRNSEELEKIEKSKKVSVKEACAWSVMDGFGLRYITPFALAAGASNAQIGLLNALPSFFGNISQLFTTKAMKKYPRKKIVFWSVLMQAIMWIFLLGAGSLFFVFGLNNQVPAYSIIIIYTVLIFVGAFGGPAWSSWMRDLVTGNRGDYFGKRSRIAGVVSILCLLIAGFILDYFKHTKIFLGFIIIFSIAFIGRLTSAFLMLKQWEPEFKCEDKYYFTFIQFLKKMRHNNFGKFVIYFSLMTLATNIAGPFFAVYMLKNLGFSYAQYMTVILSSSIAALLFMPAWGKFADRYGSLKVMAITGFLVPVIPFLWLATGLSSDNTYLTLLVLMIEAIGGFLWAGFNLAAGNFIYDAVSRQRLAICVSYFNILAGIGVLIGATLGGFLSSFNFIFFGMNPLISVFILSGVLRFGVQILSLSKIKEVREVRAFDTEEAKNKIKGLSIKKFFEYLDIKIFAGGSSN